MYQPCPAGAWFEPHAHAQCPADTRYRRLSLPGNSSHPRGIFCLLLQLISSYKWNNAVTQMCLHNISTKQVLTNKTRQPPKKKHNRNTPKVKFIIHQSPAKQWFSFCFLKFKNVVMSYKYILVIEFLICNLRWESRKDQ